MDAIRRLATWLVGIDEDGRPVDGPSTVGRPPWLLALVVLPAAVGGSLWLLLLLDAESSTTAVAIPLLAGQLVVVATVARRRTVPLRLAIPLAIVSAALAIVVFYALLLVALWQACGAGDPPCYQ